MSRKKSTTDVREDLRHLVAEILETEPSKITPESHFVTDLGMDSMMALEILAGVEKKYKIIIPEESLPKFTSINETVAIVEEILNKKK